MWIKLAAVVLGIGLIIGWSIIDDFDAESVRGKRVFVTGASTGIGEQLAYEFCRLGADVVITARREAVLKQVIEKCKQLGRPNGKYIYLTADMSNLNAIEPLVQHFSTGYPRRPTTGCQNDDNDSKRERLPEDPLRTLKILYSGFGLMDASSSPEWDSGEPHKHIQYYAEASRRLGGLDYLVLNHIAPYATTAWTGSAEDFAALDHRLDVNFKSYVHLATYALPELEKSQGRIVVVSSVCGKFGTPLLATYSTSKFALDGFFSSLRQELIMRDSPVSVTLAVLGLVDTESAMNTVKRFGTTRLTVTPVSPVDTARAIIEGGAKRQWEAYFPYMKVRILMLLRDWFPQSLAMLARSFFTR